jgi:beta-glucuronidase
MKHSVLISLFLFIGLTVLQAQEICISNSDNRTFTSLNGKWKYVLDPYETGQIGFMPVYKNSKPVDKTDRVEYSFDAAQTLWVPGAWNAQKPELQYYEGTIWYRRMFDKPDLSKNKRYFVHFGAANYLTTITFNGERLGRHEGGFTPFCVEITKFLKEKGNYLIVGVSARRADDGIPGKVTDWFNHGGITRDVKLIEVPNTFIGNYFIALDKSTYARTNKRITGTLNLVGKSFPSTAVVTIPELKTRQEVTVNSDGTCAFAMELKNLKLWSPENPKLYAVTLVAGEDTVRDQIGFRSIETKGKQILLNGKPIFLKGISLHDENPLRKDRANSEADAALVLGWVKELGCNFIRLAHYPHQENLVRMADKMGILLWEELPLYWGIDWGNKAVLEKAKRQYTELIQRDCNRASSIIWSIANETTPGEARNAFLTAIAEHIRSLDNTRLLSAACKKDQAVDGHPDNDYTLNDPIMKQLDIVSFNEYLGWYGGLPAECRKKTYRSSMEKPIIVSEFGGGALQGFYGDSLTRWSEDYQAYLYKENLAMFDKIDGLAGMTPWILADFLSPLRQLPDVQDGWNRKGLISEKGFKKKAFYVLQRYYKTK